MVHDTYSNTHNPFSVEHNYHGPLPTDRSWNPFGRVWGNTAVRDGDVLEELPSGVKLVMRDTNHGLYPVVERPGYLIDPGPLSLRQRPTPQPKPARTVSRDRQLEFSFMDQGVQFHGSDTIFSTYFTNTPEGLIEVRVDGGRFEVLAPRGRLNSSRGVLTTSTWKRYD